MLHGIPTTAASHLTLRERQEMHDLFTPVTRFLVMAGCGEALPVLEGNIQQRFEE